MTNNERVHDIMLRALYQDEHIEQPPPDAVLVEGIMGRYGFDPERLTAVKSEVSQLIRDVVPDVFLPGLGDGGSFLALAVDRDGKHWAEHQTMEALCCLAIATGQAKWCMPRELWCVLPGGMPYVSFSPDPTR